MDSRHGAATPAAASPGSAVPLWRSRWFPPVAVAVVAFGFYFLVMSYPWQLALLAATAIGALVYSTQVTAARMRRLYTLPEERGPSGDVSARQTWSEKKERSGS